MRKTIAAKELVPHVPYIVEEIRLITPKNGDIAVICDIKTTTSEENDIYSVFLPGRYNKPEFHALLSITYQFDEMSLFYEGEQVFGVGKYSTPTPKLRFEMKKVKGPIQSALAQQLQQHKQRQQQPQQNLKRAHPVVENVDDDDDGDDDVNQPSCSWVNNTNANTNNNSKKKKQSIFDALNIDDEEDIFNFDVSQK